MCSLDEVPFKVALDSVEIQLGQKEPVTAPELTIPDCAQILRDTKVRIVCLYSSYTFEILC